MDRELKLKLGYTRKVTRKINPRRDDLKRAAYTVEIAAYPPAFLLFGDESAIAERALKHNYGRGPRGQRVEVVGAISRSERYSLLPIVSLDGLLVYDVRDGPYTAKTFERFLRTQVVRTKDGERELADLRTVYRFR